MSATAACRYTIWSTERAGKVSGGQRKLQGMKCKKGQRRTKVQDMALVDESAGDNNV